MGIARIGVRVAADEHRVGSVGDVDGDQRQQQRRIFSRAVARERPRPGGAQLGQRLLGVTGDGHQLGA